MTSGGLARDEAVNMDEGFSTVIADIARLDTLALRVSQGVLTFGEETLGVVTIDVVTEDEWSAERLVTRHRLVPAGSSPLALCHAWAGWLPEASGIMPVSVLLRLVDP